jgi:hypothetical protein
MATLANEPRVKDSFLGVREVQVTLGEIPFKWPPYVRVLDSAAAK